MIKSLPGPSALKWRCRRGMLELDIFLIPFCESIYPTLSEQLKETFVDLLEEEDVELFEWLMARDKPENTHFNAIIDLIRNHRLGL